MHPTGMHSCLLNFWGKMKLRFFAASLESPKFCPEEVLHRLMVSFSY